MMTDLEKLKLARQMMDDVYCTRDVPEMNSSLSLADTMVMQAIRSLMQVDKE